MSPDHRRSEPVASGPCPVFIFSLPRTGSTLLQRVLGAHSEISTVSEPWILLPLLYARRDTGIYAEYDHGLARGAVDDFIATLPAGGADYDDAVRAFAMRLYERAARPGASLFVDKTPRYHVVAEDVMRIFPDAKSVFLWRNPLAAAASLINTYADGQWNLYLNKVDLFDGIGHLIDAYRANQQRAYAMRYEDLVREPEAELRKLCDYLGVPWQASMLTDADRVELGGRLGDRRQAPVSADGVGSWQATFAPALRRRWARRYLSWLGRERLATMGYDLDELRAELSSTPATFDGVAVDAARMLYGTAWSGLEPVLVRDKVRRLRDWRGIHAHP